MYNVKGYFNYNISYVINSLELFEGESIKLLLLLFLLSICVCRLSKCDIRIKASWRITRLLCCRAIHNKIFVIETK